MTENWYDAQPQSAYSNFKGIPVSENWFEVYEISTNLFVFYEPRHYEATIVNLIIGDQSASSKRTNWRCCVPRVPSHRDVT
jgi:hypothetical protein